MLSSSVPKPIRSLIIISAAFLIASLGISGFNAYVTLAAPPQAPYVPSTVGFEGQLASADGSPVADGDYSITFRLYDVASGGSALWTETQMVTVTDGLYSAQLGSTNPLNATYFEGSRWLGLKVGTDSEMTPRIPISAVPFALNAQQAMGIQGRDVSTSAPANNDALLWDQDLDQWIPGNPRGIIDNSIAQGRLTLESGNPIPTTDQLNKTTIYFTPYIGNRIALYDGSEWEIHTFSEVSLPVPVTTSNTNFDIFIYDNSGTLTLEAVTWASDTTRSVELVRQDGVLVRNGAATRRYLGTIRSTETAGQTEDSARRRLVWNMYNRVHRQLFRQESTTFWYYGTTTWRYSNNSSLNRLEWVLGLNENPVWAMFSEEIICGGSMVRAQIGLGLDWVSGPPAIQSFVGNYLTSGNTAFTPSVHYNGYSGIGYHYLAALEYAVYSTPGFYGGAGYNLGGFVIG